VTYGIVINTYAKLGDTARAIHWFEAMVAVRLRAGHGASPKR
jgi:pentatricopeptide repeat protein